MRLVAAQILTVLAVTAGFAAAPREVAAREPAAAEPTPERRWMKHRVVPGERIDDVAARYGVSRAELIRWNRALKKKAWIYAGKKLTVYARKFPPPREKTSYRVQRGDTWAEIATKYRVTARALRKWNPKVPKAFRAGTKLTVYTNPAAPPPAAAAALATTAAGATAAATVTPVPEFNVRSGGLSVGRPNRGRLLRGVQLPKSNLYTVRDKDLAYGSTHTVLNLQKAIFAFRRDSGFTGPLVVASISKKGGGRFRPHSSHQSGRDVDLRLPRKRRASKKSDAPDTIDWTASWHLLKSLADTKQVEYIFLDYSRQWRLYRAGQAAGASKKELRRLIQYPRARKTSKGLVRHAKGHNIHIHIRFRCAPRSSACVSI